MNSTMMPLQILQAIEANGAQSTNEVLLFTLERVLFALVQVQGVFLRVLALASLTLVGFHLAFEHFAAVHRVEDRVFLGACALGRRGKSENEKKNGIVKKREKSKKT